MSVFGEPSGSQKLIAGQGFSYGGMYEKVGFCFVVVLVICCVSFMACNYGFESQDAVPYRDAAEIGGKYQDMLDLMVNFGTRTVETLLEYAEPTDDMVLARSLQHQPRYVDVENIGDFLKISPDRATRSLRPGSRDASFADGEAEENIALEVALQEIADAFQARWQPLSRTSPSWMERRVLE